MRLIKENKKRFLPLLLLADPEEAMIDRYLEDGELWVWEEGRPQSSAWQWCWH